MSLERFERDNDGELPIKCIKECRLIQSLEMFFESSMRTQMNGELTKSAMSILI